MNFLKVFHLVLAVGKQCKELLVPAASLSCRQESAREGGMTLGLGELRAEWVEGGPGEVEEAAVQCWR